MGPWAAIVLGIAALALAAPLAAALPERLVRGAGRIPGSEAAAVREVIAREFPPGLAEPLVVALATRRLDMRAPAPRALVRRLSAEIAGVPGVAFVVGPESGGPFRDLATANGRAVALLVSGRGGVGGAMLAPVRAAAARTATALRALEPGAEAAVTGPAALADDLVARAVGDARRAEALALVPLIALTFALFRSVTAAVMPLALGASATLLAWAGLAALAPHVMVNAYAQTAASLLGLALGVDYAMLMVHRFREQRRAGDAPWPAAAAAWLATGPTIAMGGAIVALALGSLTALGMTDAVSIGLGGALAATAAAALALLLLPAALVALAPWLGQAGPLRGPTPLRGRAGVVGALVATLALAALGTAGARLAPGLPDARWLPAELEAARGRALLAPLGRQGEMAPVLLLVRAADGGPLYGPAGVAALAALSHRLRADGRVARVASPVDLLPGLGVASYQRFYAAGPAALRRLPAPARGLWASDGRAALFHLVPRGGQPVAAIQALVRDWRASGTSGLALAVGGAVALELDHEARLRSLAPGALALIVAIAGLGLGLAFRSLLVPAKAIALNLLATGAATGALVLVFQEGWLAAWVGLPGPLGRIPLMVPVLVFALAFALTIDYELFLLGRVREARAAGLGEAEAVDEGLGALGGVVTGAAAAMAIVSLAFVGADLAPVKMFGFAAAVAVGLDATLIRLVIAPVVLRAAGRWNWWPGERDNCPDVPEHAGFRLTSARAWRTICCRAWQARAVLPPVASRPEKGSPT